MTKPECNHQMMRLASRFGMNALFKSNDVFEIVSHMSEQKFKSAVDMFLTCREHTDPPTLIEFKRCAEVADKETFAEEFKLIARRQTRVEERPMSWWEYFI